jgi:dihydroorotate dehydrogenase
MFYRSLLRPILFRLPAETAHNLALQSLSFPFSARIAKAFAGTSPANLGVRRFGLTFPNPVGLAAGFDKDGIALPALCKLGFGFIEAGTVTWHGQPGNELPRLFRLPLDKALINRAGFNNHGAEEFARHASDRRSECILGVSIGKSKVTPLDEAIDDYLQSFAVVFPIADYVAVNVSSPNTPGLRGLQEAEQLERLLAALMEKNRELSSRTNRERELPLLVKVAPDLSEHDLEMIVDVVLRSRISGIIATNTTVARNGLTTPAETVQALGAGGLSGAPLRKRSTEMIALLFRLTKGSIPLIGVGGVFNAIHAWEKICAGASLVQIYTGMIYEGPLVAKRINEGLSEILAREGFRSVDEAVGCKAFQYMKMKDEDAESND